MLGRFSARTIQAPERDARAAPPPPVSLAPPPVPPRPEPAPEPTAAPPPPPVVHAAAKPAATPESLQATVTQRLLDAKVRLHRRLIEELNLSALEKLPEADLRREIGAIVGQYVVAERLPLNAQELDGFVTEILDEMTGLGPLEALLGL